MDSLLFWVTVLAVGSAFWVVLVGVGAAIVMAVTKLVTMTLRDGSRDQAGIAAAFTGR